MKSVNHKLIDRRDFLKVSGFGLGLLLSGCMKPGGRMSVSKRRPNILIAIADDHSYLHNGSSFIKTPAFDTVAAKGVLFSNCYCPAPQCSPSRAALLTGRNIWQLEEAGTHGSGFTAKFQVYPDILEQAGYHIGYTGKPWAPGNWQDFGRTRNPAGPEYNDIMIDNPPTTGISKIDYASNFEAFLGKRSDDAPFCFWFGAHEPHRQYEYGSGVKAGKQLGSAKLPEFLPDNDITRNDIIDYALEVEWFDTHLDRILKTLERIGGLDNTLIVVTADNGMAFPRAKANLYEYGTHVPLAIMWADEIKGGRVVDDFVSFIDFAPTFLDAAGLNQTGQMTGKSLLPVLRAKKSGIVDPDRQWVVTGRERHTHARPDNVGYPCRALRAGDFLYIFNFKPDRWPAGDPDGYYDIDGSPSKSFMLENKQQPVFDLAFAKRPEQELYNLAKDRQCLNNLACDPQFAELAAKLRSALMDILKTQKDPRVIGGGDIFESYPRFMNMKEDLPGFKEQGKYNPAFMIK